MRGKSLAFAKRLDKDLLLNGLQREVRREVGRSKRGKVFSVESGKTPVKSGDVGVMQVVIWRGYR